jgi:hypothetical protein
MHNFDLQILSINFKYKFDSRKAYAYNLYTQLIEE